MGVAEQIAKNLEKFQDFNRIKYDNFQSLIISPNIRKAINSIPILFCINDKNIPGYVDSDIVPLGIADEFIPDKDALQLYKPRDEKTELSLESHKPIIETLAVIGSGGSIAYTKESDFDYWVCIDSKKWSKEELDDFHKKSEAIQNWAMSKTHIEIHFFVNDINKIQKNIFAEDEDEAFGSTIGATLKDEFYRSSIIIGGKTPFWWVVPTITDQQYQTIYEQISKDQPNHQFVDLGNLYQIDKADFMSGALFQLIKALANPFKSILKMGVLEKYIFDSRTNLLISQELKSDIQQGIFNAITTDSYAYMYEKVFDYYKSVITDEKMLTILPQNLYLKINPQLTKYILVKEQKNIPYKTKVMQEYTANWRWPEEIIKDLDKFDSWEYKKVMDFWNQIKKFMILTYKKISQQMPLLNLQQKISESDFTLLSRKIKSLILSEPDEIDQYVTFKDTPCESLLYLEPADKMSKNPEWNMVKKDSESGTQLIKTCKDLITLISWTTINNIYNPQLSRVQIESSYYKVNQDLIVHLMNEIYEMFLLKSIKIKNSYYLQPVFNITNIIIINFNLTNATSIQTIHHLYRTSWGQNYIKYYKSEQDIFDVLEKTINDGFRLKRPFDDYCSVITPEPSKKLYRDYIRIFKETYNAIIFSDANVDPKFLIKIAGNYLTILSQNNTVDFSIHENIIKCLAKISLKPSEQSKLHFFGEDVGISVVQKITKIEKPKNFLVAYESLGTFLLVYTFDGNGNLFTFIKPNNIKDKYIISHFHFCQNTINSIPIEEIKYAVNHDVDFYLISRTKQGQIEIAKSPLELYPSSLKTITREHDINVAIMNYGTQQQTYSVKTIRGESPFVPFASLKSALINTGFNHATEIPIVSKIDFLETQSEEVTGIYKYFSEKYKIELVLSK